MGGAKFPAWGKSPAVAKSVGAPTEAEAQAFRPRSGKPAFPGAAPPFRKAAANLSQASGPGVPKGPSPRAVVITPKTVRPMAIPKQRTGFHLNTAIPRGHLVKGRLRTP